MKKIILFALLFSLYACKGKNHQPKYTQQSHQHWIPNWSKDTLVAVSNNQNGSLMTDIMLSETINDTSVIYYRNEKYYVWTENIKYETFRAYYHFGPDQKTYNNVVISKIPFTNKINEFYSEAYSAEPSRYYDSLENRWKEQEQAISAVKIPDAPTFYFSGYYSTSNKQFLD